MESQRVESKSRSILCPTSRSGRAADPGKHRADAPCAPKRWPGNKSRHKRAAEAPLGLESCGRNTGTPYGHWLGRKEVREKVQPKNADILLRITNVREQRR